MVAAHKVFDFVFLIRKFGEFKVKEPPSLWENPYSATTSWKSCAERRDGGISGNGRICLNIVYVHLVDFDYWMEITATKLRPWGMSVFQF